jgi:two-component system osmolarity sensor histidine kinase EnvZ
VSSKVYAGCVVVAGGFLVSLLAHTFMERHWDQVTRRLTEAVARDMAAIVDLYEAGSTKEDIARLIQLGRDRFGLALTVQPAGPLPAAQPKPFFDLLDRALSDEIRVHIRRPFWIDTLAQSRHVEVRIKLEQANLHLVAPRTYAYASNSHIFLIWMVGTWVLLLAACYVILRR